MPSKVRVRIAPSPTGEPHVGTAYIALFNYCFAKSQGGDFILRIEDTDQARSSKQSETSIFQALRWLGFQWDEGPDTSGPFGPYRQSERTGIYKKHAQELVGKGAAYPCFCTPVRLDEIRKKLAAEKKNLGYDGACRAIPHEEANRRMAAGEPHVIRLKVNRDGDVRTSFFDEIRKKEVEYSNNEIDDQVLLKTDGFPTYHLANVVDDHLMGITHVIRAEEWIPSTPKHVLLYRAFGWDAPKFAHVSLLRNADKSKVSKRKNPVSLNWFRAAGYTREAIINFLGLMGYFTGSEAERFGLDELMQGFTLDKISTSAPIFDLVKLQVLNEEYIRKFTAEQYITYLKETVDFAARYLGPVLPHVQERHKIGLGFNVWTDMFFRATLDYTVEGLVGKGMEKKQAEEVLKKSAVALEDSKAGTPADFEQLLSKIKDESGAKPGAVLMTLRVAITGSSTSLPLYEAMAMLGKDRTVIRLKEANAFLRSR
ncbi:MAG: glutamate--tRNA ligase [Fibrobacterota bacterium]